MESFFNISFSLILNIFFWTLDTIHLNFFLFDKCSAIKSGPRTVISFPTKRALRAYILNFFLPFRPFLARLDEVQEELLYYPGGGVGKMLKFLR